MTLNNAQTKMVEENMGLVKTVIARCVHNIPKSGLYTYEDLYQIGCGGLCKAAYEFKPAAALFCTFAFTVIRNEIYKALEYASLRNSRELLVDHTDEPFAANHDDPQETAQARLAAIDLETALKDAQQRLSGVAVKGVEAILLRGRGLSCKQIGELYGARDNVVTAWMSKARKALKDDPAFMQALGHCR